MTTAELKNDLHRLVVETQDTSILQQVRSIFSILLSGKDKDDWWDTLSEQQKVLINRSLRQANHGELIPHQVVREEINRMLGKN